jgi:hypothetical protein
MLYLWLVKRKDSIGYDEYDSFICCTATEREARSISPSKGEWGGSWPVSDVSVLEVTKVGRAEKHIKSGEIVLSSFNAG